MKIKSLPFCLLFALCTNTYITLSAQAVNEQDSLALVDLYKSSNGSKWVFHDKWLTGSVRTWYGITVTGGRVTELDLAYNSLNGTIPSSIGNLVNLQYLNLSGNKLYDTIPSSIGNLINLTSLYLSSTELSGTIPSSIGNLVNLTKLSLDNSHLSSAIPSSIGNLVHLNYLYLNDNQLSGTIPASIGNLVNVTTFILSNNKLSGNIPSSLGNLASVILFDLSNNQLSDTIPASFGNLINAHFLYLYSNELSGAIPSSLGNLVNLSTLVLRDNQLSGNIPSSFGNLANLGVLYLNNNQLSGTIPASLGNLPRIYELHLNNNQLEDTIPSSLGNLVTLFFSLRLDHNQLSGVIPTSFGNLVNLRGLDLSHNKLSGKIPQAIAHLALLHRLDLSYNAFTFDGMELIATFSSAIYAPQSEIPLYRNGNALSVSAGGTLSNNTYKWFMVGQSSPTTIAGDSVFHPSQNGKYFATVTNSVATNLTLHTDTIEYDIALPVTIINLKAHQQDNIIKVEWTSLTEINVAHYEVERSSNALAFVAIGNLPAASHGTERRDYSFNDLHPLQGNNYYHIKATDKDGKTTYSNTILVNMNDKTVTIVYPNPARDILHIETNGTALLSLADQSGKILLTTNITGKGSINISGFGAGVYFLKNNISGAVQKVTIAR